MPKISLHQRLTNFHFNSKKHGWNDGRNGILKKCVLLCLKAMKRPPSDSNDDQNNQNKKHRILNEIPDVLIMMPSVKVKSSDSYNIEKEMEKSYSRKAMAFLMSAHTGVVGISQIVQVPESSDLKDFSTKGAVRIFILKFGP